MDGAVSLVVSLAVFSRFLFPPRRYMTDLIGEAGETKIAIEEAHETIQNAHDAVHTHAVANHQTNQAVQQVDVFESNLFGFDGGAADSNSVTYHNTTARPQANSFDNFSHDGLSHDGSQQPSGAPLPVPHIPSTVQEQQSLPPAPVQSRPPPVETQSSYEIPLVTTFGSDIANPGGPDAGPPEEAPAPAPKPAHHRIQSSVGFGGEYVMGGAATPLPFDGGALSPPAMSQSMSSTYGYDDETMQHVEMLKKKVEGAQETAKDAEVIHRKLTAEADELRADADRAEATARSLRAAGQEKKKGVFGGGGGKKKKTMVRSSLADLKVLNRNFLSHI